MKRRSIFTMALGALSACAATSVSAQPEAKTEVPEATHPKKEEFDLVIIGSGAAGLTAAIEAADRGAKVVVLEKLSSPMGNTIYAGGNFNATNTWVQKRDGIKDNVDDFFKDMMAVSMQRGDRTLTRMFCDQSADVVQWLTDRIHMEWKPIDVQIAPMLGRCHEVVGGNTTGGAKLIQNMLAEAKKLGIDIRNNTKAVELIRGENLECLGVRTAGKNGRIDFYARGGVVLCTGGFHNNKELVTRYMGGDVAWMPLRGSPYITGENIILTEPFFPMYVNMDQFHAGPINAPTRANPSNMVNFGICVTPEGKRYIDENSTYVFVGQNTPKRIKNNQAFIIIDSQVVDNPIVARRIKRYQKAKAIIYKADSIAELAKQAGLPIETTVNTVKEFNEMAKAGKGSSLNVPNTMEKPHLIEKGPFYAFNFSGGMTATFGGPKINKNAEILNAEGRPIPGLYGAGNAVGGIFYDNYLDGSQLTAAVIWGRVAANQAVTRAKATTK